MIKSTKKENLKVSQVVLKVVSGQEGSTLKLRANLFLITYPSFRETCF